MGKEKNRRKDGNKKGKEGGRKEGVRLNTKWKLLYIPVWINTDIIIKWKVNESFPLWQKDKILILIYFIHLKSSLILVKAYFIIFNNKDYHYSKLKQWLKEFCQFWLKRQNLFKIAVNLFFGKNFKLQLISLKNFINFPNIFSYFFLKLFSYEKLCCSENL